MTKRLSSTALTALLLIPLASCGGSGGTVASGCGSGGDIVVGVIAPETGAAHAIVGSFEAGAEQARDDINAKGGVCGGRHISVVEKDNESDFSKDAGLAKELVEQDHAVGVVLISDQDQQAAGQYLQQKGVLTVCACISDALDTAPDTFSVAIPNKLEAPLWKQYLLVTKHVKRPAVLYETTSSFGLDQTNAFCNDAQSNGTPCVAREQTTIATTSVAQQVGDMVSHNADAVLLEGFGLPVVATISSAKAAGLTGPILGTGTVATSTNLINGFVPASSRAGFVYVDYRTATHGDTNAATAFAQELIASNRIGSPVGPLFVPMFAHDAVELMATGWNKANSLNAGDASKAIEQLNVKVGDGTFTLHDAVYSPQHHEPQVAGWLTLATADPLDNDGLATVSSDAAGLLSSLGSAAPPSP